MHRCAQTQGSNSYTLLRVLSKRSPWPAGRLGSPNRYSSAPRRRSASIHLERCQHPVSACSAWHLPTHTQEHRQSDAAIAALCFVLPGGIIHNNEPCEIWPCSFTARLNNLPVNLHSHPCDLCPVEQQSVLLTGTQGNYFRYALKVQQRSGGMCSLDGGCIHIIMF